MSIFISYNYATGFKAAQAIAAQLESYGIDVWWLPAPLQLNQVDMVVEQALAVCQRCIVIQSSEHLSDWQHTEVDSIQQRLKSYHPPTDVVDFFMVVRVPYGEDDTMPKRPIPLLQCSEYIDCPVVGAEVTELKNIRDHVPGLSPLKFKRNRLPYLHTRAGNDCTRGRWSFTGGFKDTEYSGNDRYCWLFLEDHKGKWYIQHPRPTLTHAQRWIASSVVIGSNITAAVLAALSLEAHHQMVAEVLTAQWGALYPIDFEDKKLLCRRSKKHINEVNCILGEVIILDHLAFQ